ncbi:uncharacterized protein [Littorina saxatilis]|uniref:Protein kinase domain-containing protein n=1 Tax=Littorina saxatilis TaxID=31220 RepID=A0AAN9BLH9_9CAEN
MSRDPREADPERRKKVGQYVLGPCLGEGSFAKVRIGTHTISKEKVAVKIVLKRVIIRRDVARRNFRREALLLQHVCHPNIVCLFEAMETPNSYYLVFELADNGNLLNYLTERRCLEEQESRHFFRQIVSAVDHLHRSGIVHRDLKLDNFLLNKNWDVKIVDFGLSALCQRETTLHTQCGSPLYAAPEIFGNRRYGTAVDLWSLGVCLYATVVGRLPFVPDPPTNLPLLHALILKGVVLPTFLSPSLQQLLSGLLEVQESRRLSITDLLHQSWVTCNGNQPIPRFLPIAKAPPPCVDTNVVRYMTTMFRFGESDVIHSVTERKLNASSATYHLLKRHTESQNSTEERTAAVEGDIRATSRYSKATDRSEVLSEGRQNLRPHVLINNRSQNQDADGGVGGNSNGNSHNPSNYKECILYLKEARCGISLSGRSLAKLQKDIGTVDVVAASSKSRDALLHKLPLLNSQRHPLGNSLHGNGGTSGQCYDSMRQYLHPVPSPDVRLNVMGRPVLKRRGIKGESLGSGDRGRSSTDTENNLTVIDRPEAKNLSSNSNYNRVSVNLSSLGIPKAPPVPPNTAQGARFYQDQQISLRRDSSPRSSVSSPRLESSLQDPFNSDTWRNVSRHDPRLSAESEAQYGGGPGSVAYVGPLSSPKALTNREENETAKKHKYFLVRQLGSETIHRRNFREAETLEPLMSKSLAPTKVSNNHDDSSNDDDDKYDDEDDESPRPRTSDGFRAESLDHGQFLTPVIRVTITSTAKQ